MRKAGGALGALFLVSALVACGGGGGDDNDAPPVTFTPNGVTITTLEGTSGVTRVRATAADTSMFSNALYVYVIDGEGVIQPNVSLSVESRNSVLATVQSSPSLAVGQHKGTLQIRLCNDFNCTSQVRGSPMSLPYDVTVNENPNLGLLSFSPYMLSSNVTASTSATMTVRGNSTRPWTALPETLHARAVDTKQVILPNVEVARLDGTSVSTTFHTAPSLAAGRYQGTVEVQLCTDAACTSQVKGSPFSMSYDISVTQVPLRVVPTATANASFHRGEARSVVVPVSVNGPALSWTASSSVPWLTLGRESGTGSGTFDVTYTPQGMAEGNYDGTIAVRSADAQTVSVPFKLQVLPTSFVVSGGTPTFSAINGAPIAAQEIKFTLDSNTASPWTMTPPASWLLASPSYGTTPTTLTLQPDPSRGALASGTYQTQMVLSSANAADKQINVQLSLTKATLSAPATTVTLGGPKGRDSVATQKLTLSLNTGTNTWPFFFPSLPSWLSTSSPSGLVGQAGTPVTFTPRTGNATPGSQSATVTATATVNGDTVTLPITVNLNLDQRRLLVSEPGIAFSTVPGASVLSRTIEVRDNFSGALPWSATSDAAWLSVTSTGTTGAGNMVLTASPAALPDGSLSLATVTIVTVPTDVEPTRIRVGLWKSATGLTAITKLPQAYFNLTADKIRPYIYANNQGTSIDVLHAHTAQKIATVAGVGGSVGRMAVSPDGSRLYVLDTAARSVVVVNLDTLTTTATWPLDLAVGPMTNIVAVSPAGVDVVLLSDGTSYMNGRSLGGTGLFGKLLATPDSRTLVNESARYSLDYSAMSGGMLFVTRTAYLAGGSGGNLQDTAINADASRVYQASGGGVSNGGYKCASIDGVSGTYIGALPGGEAYPNNVEVLRDGRVVCAIDGYYSNADLFLHAPNGALLQSYKLGTGTILADRLVTSPDGFVLVGVTADHSVSFLPVLP